MSRSKFTIEEGLLVQFGNLATWKRKLNTSTYKALSAECLERNNLLSLDDSGFQVFRGGQLTEFIENYKPTKQ